MRFLFYYVMTYYFMHKFIQLCKIYNILCFIAIKYTIYRKKFFLQKIFCNFRVNILY